MKPKRTKAEKSYPDDADRITWLKKQFPQIKILTCPDRHRQGIRVRVPANQPVRGFHLMPANCRPGKAKHDYPPIDEGDTCRAKGLIRTCNNGLHGAQSLTITKENWDYGPTASSCLFWGEGDIDVRKRYVGSSSRSSFYVYKWAFRYRKHVAMVNTTATERHVALEECLKATVNNGKRQQAAIKRMMKNPLDSSYELFFSKNNVLFRHPPVAPVVKRVRDQLRRRVKKLTTNEVRAQKESA